MLYITGPQAGAKPSWQYKGRRKYDSASVQVPTGYNTLYMKPTYYFLQIMKMQFLLLTTREQSVYTPSGMIAILNRN